jgi:hypothetical protein
MDADMKVPREMSDAIFDWGDVDKSGKIEIAELWRLISTTEGMSDAQARAGMTEELFYEVIMPALGGGTAMDRDQLYRAYTVFGAGNLAEDYAAIRRKAEPISPGKKHLAFDSRAMRKAPAVGGLLYEQAKFGAKPHTKPTHKTLKAMPQSVLFADPEPGKCPDGKVMQDKTVSLLEGDPFYFASGGWYCHRYGIHSDNVAGSMPPSGRGGLLPPPCYASTDEAGVVTVYSGMAYREAVELQDREKKQKILNERYYRRISEIPGKEHAKVVELLKKTTDKLLENPVETAWTPATIRRLDATSSKDLSSEAPRLSKQRWSKARGSVLGQFRSSKDLSS